MKITFIVSSRNHYWPTLFAQKLPLGDYWQEVVVLTLDYRAEEEDKMPRNLLSYLTKKLIFSPVLFSYLEPANLLKIYTRIRMSYICPLELSLLISQQFVTCFRNLPSKQNISYRILNWARFCNEYFASSRDSTLSVNTKFTSVVRPFQNFKFDAHGLRILTLLIGYSEKGCIEFPLPLVKNQQLDKKPVRRINMMKTKVQSSQLSEKENRLNQDALQRKGLQNVILTKYLLKYIDAQVLNAMPKPVNPRTSQRQNEKRMTFVQNGQKTLISSFTIEVCSYSCSCHVTGFKVAKAYTVF